MVDSGDDFNIDLSKISEKINQRTKAIIPVDIAGWPCDYGELNKLVNDKKVKDQFRASHPHQRLLGRILILADSAHSIGARYNGKPIGNWADFTVFSFHAVKNITTAEGGAIVINLPADRFDSDAVYAQVKLWSLNGQTKDAFAKSGGAGWRYDIVYAGFKMNMPDVLAAIGLAQLKKYNGQILPERRRDFQSYCEQLKSFRWVKLPPLDSESKKSSYHLFPLRIHGITEAQRDAIIERITEQGVAVNVHFQPLPMLTLFRERGFKCADFPKAFDNYSREISLPIYPELDSKKINYIVSTVVSAYERVVNG
jgi:dTDP-4-amino-4,6-dideoxygalactose transaminase